MGAGLSFKPHFRFERRTDRTTIAQRLHEMRLQEGPRWHGGHHPTGDAKSAPVPLSFKAQLRIEFRGLTVSSDAGLLLPREADEHLGLSAMIDRCLSDPRTRRASHSPVSL